MECVMVDVSMLLQAPASSSSPPAALSSVSLADVLVEEVSVILENLRFSTLADPFRRNGISGESFNYIDSYTDIRLGQGRHK